MKSDDRLIHSILTHELSGEANFKLRDEFYKEITQFPVEKKNIFKQMLKNIPGTQFELLTGSTMLESDVTEEQKRIFQEDGYLFPLKLKAHHLNEIYSTISDLSFINRLNGNIIKGYEVTRSLAESSSLPDIQGTYWLNAGSEDHEKLIASDVMQQIAFDPVILNLVSEYLGATPIHVATNVWISGKSKEKEELSRNAQEFHKDCGFLHFIKVFIYLSDTGIEQGPHIYIRGSCNKNIEEVCNTYSASQRFSENDLLKVFKNEDFVTITGDKCTIVFGDTSCFHKGMPIVSGGRLVMNLEYASSLFGSSVNYFNTELKSKYTHNMRPSILARASMNYNQNGFIEYQKYHSKWNTKFKQILKKMGFR